VDIATSKNKIVEVLAYAREVSIRHGHTRRYAKHFVALAIKQIMHLTDRELAEFLSKSEIGMLIILDIGILGISKINEYVENYKEDGVKVIILNAKARPTPKR